MMMDGDQVRGAFKIDRMVPDNLSLPDGLNILDHRLRVLFGDLGHGFGGT